MTNRNEGKVTGCYQAKKGRSNYYVVLSAYDFGAEIDIASNFIIPAGANITLASAGADMFRLIANRDMPAIDVETGAMLTIENIVITRLPGTSGHGIRTGGTLIINDGIISNHTSYGVLMNDSTVGLTSRSDAVLIMNGGEIRENIASIGAAHGVGMSNGDFTMNGGVIRDNAGSGVYVSSSTTTFTMNGGEIINNTTDGGGGGVLFTGSLTGIFNMYGGTISHNYARQNGGGVFLNSGIFNMTDGIISDNTSGNNGGGVAVNGTFTISGGWIFDNIVDRVVIGVEWDGDENIAISGGAGGFHNNIFNAADGAIGSSPQQ